MSVRAELLVAYFRLTREKRTWNDLRELEREIRRSQRPSYDRTLGDQDPTRPTLMGDSAGGGLCLALAQQFRDEGHPQPRWIVLLSPRPGAATRARSRSRTRGSARCSARWPRRPACRSTTGSTQEWSTTGPCGGFPRDVERSTSSPS